jgi:uncharacterized protein (TIGR02246 family)
MPRVFIAAALLTLLSSGLQAQATDVGQTIQKLEHQWADATVRGDTAAVARIEPPDAVLTYADGSTATGASDVHALASGDVKLSSIKVDSMHVRSLSPTVAIVTGHVTLKGTAKSPKGAQEDISGEYRFLDVWHRQSGQWQVAASQGTKIGH